MQIGGAFFWAVRVRTLPGGDLGHAVARDQLRRAATRFHRVWLDERGSVFRPQRFFDATNTESRRPCSMLSTPPKRVGPLAMQLR